MKAVSCVSLKKVLFAGSVLLTCHQSGSALVVAKLKLQACHVNCREEIVPDELLSLRRALLAARSRFAWVQGPFGSNRRAQEEIVALKRRIARREWRRSRVSRQARYDAALKRVAEKESQEMRLKIRRVERARGL